MRVFNRALALAAVLSVSLAGAGFAAPKTLKVLCTTYPMYIFTSSVARGAAGVSVTPMLPSTLGCPHDYVLTPQDMRKLADADVLVINGLGMEEFLGPSIKKTNPRLKIIDTSLGQKNLVRLEGHEDHDGHGEGANEHHHHHAGDYNPHLFSSPRRASRIVAGLGESLAAADPKNAALYRKNAFMWSRRLSDLAADFEKAVKSFSNKRIVTQHSVFDYLAADCGLYIAAVVEEEPGQEPSAYQMLEIVRDIKENKAAAVFTEPQYPAKVGETIAREARVPVAVLDPVANGPEGADLGHYETVMRKNLETLKRILGKK